MPDNGPRQAEDRKFFGKHRLRDKIFASRDDAAAAAAAAPPPVSREPPPSDRFSLNDDVVDFLKPSTTRARFQAAARIAPKLDVSAAQRWPNASDLKSSGISPAFPPPANDRRLARRQLNLHVDFARTPPEVIGEGGDEAELPSIAVRRTASGRTRYNAPAAAPTGAPAAERGGPYGATKEDQGYGTSTKEPRPADSAYGGSRGSENTRKSLDEGDFHPGVLKRSGTGFVGNLGSISRPSVDSDDYRESFDSDKQRRPLLPSVQTSFTGAYQSSGDRPRLPEINSVIADSPIELRHELRHFLASEPSNPDSLAAKVKQKMGADEGRALQEARRKPQSYDDDPQPSRSNSRQDRSFQGQQMPPDDRSSYANAYVQRSGSGAYPSNNSPHDSSPSLYSVPSNDIHSAGERTIPASSFDIPRKLPTRGNTISESTSAVRPSVTSNPQQHPAHFEAPAVLSPHRRPVHSDVPRDPQLSPGRSSLRPTPSPSLRQGSSPNPSLQPSSGGYTPSHNTPSPNYNSQAQAPPPQGSEYYPQGSEMPLDNPYNVPPVRSMAHRPSKKEESSAALSDFAERVVHMRGIFRLTADIEKPLFSYSPMQCLRAAIWWFLKGRAALEVLIRARAKAADTRSPTRRKEQLSQPHVDLAKTWWIISDVFDSHPALSAYHATPANQRAESARAANDLASAEIFDVCDAVATHLKAVLSSMKRNQVMPPENALIQGQDQSIWVKYPLFTSDIQPLLSGQTSRSMASSGTGPLHNPAVIMPLNDSRNEYSYGRAFVNAFMSTDDPTTDRVHLPCIASIARTRGEWLPKLILCSQTELVTITVSNEKHQGPSWQEVEWRPRICSIYIHLPRGFTLTVEFSEQDFGLLFNVFERSRRVEATLSAAEDEKMIHEVTLLDSHYLDPARPQAFPSERVSRCRLRVFERLIKKHEMGTERRFHRNYRLLLVTSPKNKHLCCVSHEISMLMPLHIEFTADKQSNGAPAALLRLKTEAKPATMYLVFNDPKERVVMYNYLNGSTARPGESVEMRVAFKKLAIAVAEEPMKYVVPASDPLGQLQWQDVQVINVDMEGRSPIDTSKTVLSESLRIVARNAAGAMVDRMNLGPGKLLFRLSPSDQTTLTLLRDPQSDMTISLDPARADPRIPGALDELLKSLSTTASTRSYTFASLQDLHMFQMAVTGHNVLFDNIATTFAISRRRMVVPIYKQWTSSYVRVQIVQHNNMIQLLAFFADFAYADAMAIRLQPMDVFQKEKGFAVRIVDAKFPLPREGARLPEDSYVALEAGAYPGEHDDIVIGFEAEDMRELFLQSLPAQTQAKRLVSFKRKI